MQLLNLTQKGAICLTFAQKGPAKAIRHPVAHFNGKKASEPLPAIKQPRGRPRKVVEPELLQ